MNGAVWGLTEPLRLTRAGPDHIPRLLPGDGHVAPPPHALPRRRDQVGPMKIRNSLKTAKTRDKNCVVVRRRGRLYVLNKKNPRMKARQG